MQAQIVLNFAIFLLLQLLLSGCASYKIPTSRFHGTPSSSPNPYLHDSNEAYALTSPLYKIVPRHRCQLKWYDAGHWTTWAIFGNDDEGIFGEGPRRPYKPRQKNSTKKALCWWTRNPFHNFFHYGIGSAGRVNSEFTLLNCNCRGVSALCYDPVAKKNFGCRGSSILIALHGGKPFLSFRLCYPGKYKSEFYIGWRKTGAFGFKCIPLKNDCSNSFL